MPRQPSRFTQADVARTLRRLFIVRSSDDHQLVGIYHAIDLSDLYSRMGGLCPDDKIEFMELADLWIEWPNFCGPVPYPVDYEGEQYSEAEFGPPTQDLIERGDWRQLPYQSHIYFISDGQHVKIGRTNDLKARVRTLQTGTAKRLTLKKRVMGDAAEERFFHDAFADVRVQGEWFQEIGILRDYLKIPSGVI